MSRPFVGIGVICLSKMFPTSILVSKRLTNHGQGCYQLPGGHLEFGESFEQCAQRELKEETNLDSSQFELVYITNSLFSNENQLSKHYVTLFLRTNIEEPSTLQCVEPEKNTPWIWMKWKDLIESNDLFTPLKQICSDRSFSPFHQSNQSFYSSNLFFNHQ